MIQRNKLVRWGKHIAATTLLAAGVMGAVLPATQAHDRPNCEAGKSLYVAEQNGGIWYLVFAQQHRTKSFDASLWTSRTAPKQAFNIGMAYKENNKTVAYIAAREACPDDGSDGCYLTLNLTNGKDLRLPAIYVTEGNTAPYVIFAEAEKQVLFSNAKLEASWFQPNWKKSNTLLVPTIFKLERCLK